MSGESAVTRKTGRVKFFNSREGYGFIRPDDGSIDVFLDINNLPDRNRPPFPDTKCSFEPKMGKKGTPVARDVRFL